MKWFRESGADFLIIPIIVIGAIIWYVEKFPAPEQQSYIITITITVTQ